ncbi:MAG: hypothetical protein NW203_10440 [Hyphomonadaceae bacterium]|nr:hypothetical protein [Hyphomonadaceae bacterium]
MTDEATTPRGELFSAAVALRLATQILNAHFVEGGGWTARVRDDEHGRRYLSDGRSFGTMNPEFIRHAVAMLRSDGKAWLLQCNRLSEVERELVLAAEIVLSAPPKPKR